MFTTDRTHNRVTRFSADGTPIWHWSGTGPGALIDPVGIDVGPDGKVYVVDEGDGRVKVFTPAGTYLSQVGPGMFSSPWGVVVTEDSYVRVSDRSSDSIETFRPILAPSLAPGFSGSGWVGLTLKADPGQWPVPDLTFTYQWLRNGKALSGATSPKYKLGVQDAGTKVSLRITASRAGYPGQATFTTSAIGVNKLRAKAFSKLAKKKVKVGQHAKLTVRLKAKRLDAPEGTFVIKVRKKTVKTVKLKAKHAGKRTVKLPKLKAGTLRLTDDHVLGEHESASVVVRHAAPP